MSTVRGAQRCTAIAISGSQSCLRFNTCPRAASRVCDLNDTWFNLLMLS